MKYNLAECETAYLEQIAAEIVANGDPDGDINQELIAAHRRRTTFAEEMRARKTARSQMAAKAVALAIWTGVRDRHNVARLMRECAEVSA